MKDDDDVKTGQSNAFIFHDIKRQKEKYGDTFSYEAVKLAEDVLVWVDRAYEGATVYMNPRKNFLSVKVDNPGRYRHKRAVKELDERLEEMGVEIVFNERGNVNYHITEDIVT
jgi:hypothetical protein